MFIFQIYTTTKIITTRDQKVVCTVLTVLEGELDCNEEHLVACETAFLHLDETFVIAPTHTALYVIAKQIFQ